MLTKLDHGARGACGAETGLLRQEDAPPRTSSALTTSSGRTPSARVETERRKDVRIRSIYRMAFLRADGTERPCRIHNLSNAGAMIESDPTLSVGSTVEIALSSRHRVAAIVKWQRDGLAGLEYPDRLDCFSIIREIAEDHWSRRVAPTG